MKQKQKQKIKTPSTALPKKDNNLSSENKKRKLILAFIVGVFGFLLYSNTLTHGYVLDDFSAIKENNIVRQGVHAIPEIFKTSYRQGYLSVKDGLYRPLSLATYAIEWNFFPNKPSVSHFVNIVLYGLTGFLLFLLLCKFFESVNDSENRKTGEVIAFIASLLFIAHPLHVEVVANIKSRDEMLCFLFVICSFLFVFRFLESGKKNFLLLGMLTYFFSLLSKETSITFLALLPLALHFFSSASIKKNISITAFFIGTAIVYLLIRHSVLQGAMADTGVSMADNVIIGAKTFSTHFGTAFYILGLYMMKLIFPHPLSYDYSFNQIPIVSLNNIFSIASLLFFITIGSYATVVLFKSFKQSTNNEQRTTSFGILFFLITIFLFSNLVLIIGTSMGDRLMYFPSLGFCICMAILIVKLLKIETIDLKQLTTNTKLIPVLIILIFFSYKTYSRNADWKDNYTLYSHDVTIVPNSVKAHYYLGLELVKGIADAEKDIEKKKAIYQNGINELEKAVKILPSFAGTYTQMGVAYYRMKNYEKAIENYKKAAELTPSDAITLNNIGSVYFEWGKYSEAKEKFQQALHVDPRFVDAHMNLGSVCGMMKDYHNALISFQNAIRYSPDNANAYFFLAVTYQNLGDKPNADKYFQIAQQMDPRFVKSK